MITNTSFISIETPAIESELRQMKEPSPSTQTVSGSDTVHLSQAGQVTAMYQLGMTVKQIAANLGVAIQTVNAALGITTAANSTIPVADIPPSSPATPAQRV